MIPTRRRRASDRRVHLLGIHSAQLTRRLEAQSPRRILGRRSMTKPSLGLHSVAPRLQKLYLSLSRVLATCFWPAAVPVRPTASRRIPSSIAAAKTALEG